MQVNRHPKLAGDIREIAIHYGDISDQVLSSFWTELDMLLASIERNPRRHHFDACGLRRANFQKFPYHLLYEVEGNTIFLVVLRHDRRHPDFGINRQES